MPWAFTQPLSGMLDSVFGLAIGLDSVVDFGLDHVLDFGSAFGLDSVSDFCLAYVSDLDDCA
jgi:hypothetical protein